jgi:homogentisate phytyltransferase/homogentisate geranylgeranyltransferase
MLSAATLIAFARPHTLVATTMNVGLVFIHASSVTTQIDLLAAAYLLVSCLAYNIAVVGINQVYDIKVDKESKPYLPLASGKLTMKQAYSIIIICSILAFIFLVASPSPFSLWLLMRLSLIIGNPVL